MSLTGPAIDSKTQIHKLHKDSELKLDIVSQSAVYVLYPIETSFILEMRQNVHNVDEGQLVQAHSLKYDTTKSYHKTVDLDRVFWGKETFDRGNEICELNLVGEDDDMVALVHHSHTRRDCALQNALTISNVRRWLEPGDSIKSIERRAKNTFLHELLADHGIPKPNWPGSDNDAIILTQQGHVYNFHQHSSVKNLFELPAMHSEIKPGSIADIKTTALQTYILTRDGDIYEGLCAKEAKQVLGLDLGRTHVRKMKKSELRDGSTILKFTRIEIGRITGKTTIVFAEALTSKGESVIVSCGEEGYIGRDCGEGQPNSEFHLLAERYMFPTWNLLGHAGVGTAIDEEGEVWILCCHEASKYH